MRYEGPSYRNYSFVSIIVHFKGLTKIVLVAKWVISFNDITLGSPWGTGSVLVEFSHKTRRGTRVYKEVAQDDAIKRRPAKNQKDH